MLWAYKISGEADLSLRKIWCLCFFAITKTFLVIFAVNITLEFGARMKNFVTSQFVGMACICTDL